MNINIKIIENKMDKYQYYIQSLSWDTKHTYSLDNDYIGVDWLLCEMVGAFINDKIVGLGCINTNYINGKLYAELSNIVNKKYRKNGISNLLQKFMFNYCIKLNVDIMRVNMLESNKISIHQATKNNFELVGKNNKILTYEKELINKK